jgi:hypothetical protein
MWQHNRLLQEISLAEPGQGKPDRISAHRRMPFFRHHLGYFIGRRLAVAATPNKSSRPIKTMSLMLSKVIY